MKMADFKALDLEERLVRLNNHLTNIKDLGGRLEDNFKNDEFNFSYSLLKKNAKDLGITVDGKHYVAYANGEVLPQQDADKNENLVEQKQTVVNADVLQLTNEEIMFVKELFRNQQNPVKQPLFLPQFTGAKKTTGISVYIELWERWGEFKNQYAMYSGTDLLALALEEFMDKYSDE